MRHELIWIMWGDRDDGFPIVTTDPQQATDWHEDGARPIAYVPNGTSVSPLQAAPWKSEADHLAGR